MIEYIKGQLAELTPALAVVEAAGVGYALNISLTTYSGIQGKKEVKLYVHEALTTGGRDDSFTLFGFVNKQERELYRLLITVSGVGANTARMMLSSMNPTELCNAIANGDERMIKTVKGNHLGWRDAIQLWAALPRDDATHLEFLSRRFARSAFRRYVQHAQWQQPRTNAHGSRFVSFGSSDETIHLVEETLDMAHAMRPPTDGGFLHAQLWSVVLRDFYLRSCP